MKKKVIILIYHIIYLIDKKLMKKYNKDSNIDNVKFLDILKCYNMYIKTDYGFVPFSEINLTIPYYIHELTLENGLKLSCADEHLLFDNNHNVRLLKDLKRGDNLTTINGVSKVKNVQKINKKVFMFDFSVETNEKSYFTNGILSHNTICTVIFMLHTILFNNQKNIMIIANKGDTVKEIIKKIKDIYVEIPYHMKCGVINWGERKIALENGSVIHTQLRSKEPAIGFSIDILYIDEFAKIPDNIIRPYYTSAIPTVSSMENSKIIITSTPEGFNLFWELLVGSEKDHFDPTWNGYVSKRVYWWQVKGRRDTKLYINKERLNKFKFTESSIIKYLKNECNYDVYQKYVNDDMVYNIRFEQDNDSTRITEIKKLRYNGVPLLEFIKITNWEEEQTLLLDSPTSFKKEYDLLFLADDKLLFNSVEIESIREKIKKFEPITIPSWVNDLNIPYTNLKFITDEPHLFNMEDVKKYRIFMSIDLADGLGGDYSTINIFRLLPKSEQDIEKYKHTYTNVYDFFTLYQIGLWRSNIYSIDEIAHILYMLTYDLFNPDNIKIVLEMNRGYGAILLSKLPNVFNGDNLYGSNIFLRYKHREGDNSLKIGLNVSRSNIKGSTGKNVLIKEYQSAIKNKNIILHEEITIKEISTFVKKETTGGNITYKAESGHDDCIMTVINISSVFDHVIYKTTIEDYIQHDLTDNYKSLIYNFSDKIVENNDMFTPFTSKYKSIYKTNNVNEKSNIDVKNIDTWWGKKMI
jgi:hypothetical protein